MKYVILSFDDGAIDFKENAYPVLKKFNLTASLNVVSGFIDNTIKVNDNIISEESINPNLSMLSVEDVIFFHTNGYEIANHTNSHLKGGSYNELETCNAKINEWCKIKNPGIVMPKYSKPTKSAFRYISEVNSPYVTYRDWRISFNRFVFSSLFYKFIFLLSKNEKYRLKFLLYHCMYKKGCCKRFLRLSINEKTDPFMLYKIINHLPDNYCLTLCFHSISNYSKQTLYPGGSWSIKKFYDLCNYLNNNSNIKVISQIDACKS